VFEADIRVKSARLMKSRLKTRKKEQNVEIRDILHKAQSRKLFWNGIRNLLRRANGRGSADIIYHI